MNAFMESGSSIKQLPEPVEKILFNKKVMLWCAL